MSWNLETTSSLFSWAEAHASQTPDPALEPPQADDQSSCIKHPRALIEIDDNHPDRVGLDD